MSEWWTYTLSDIQSFSLETWHRFLERYNAAIWPAQILALALGLVILALLRRPDLRRGRIIAAILAACWLWIAIAFFAMRYAKLTWIAVYFAWGFGLEAALLLWAGLVRGRLAFERRPAGLAVFLFALVVLPLIGRLLSGSFRQVEVFGVTPDPTVVGTLGILLLATGRVRWELIALPAIWCAVSGASLAAMDAPASWIVPAAAALVVTLAAWRTSPRRRKNPRKDTR
jgi:hypothetical protein